MWLLGDALSSPSIYFLPLLLSPGGANLLIIISVSMASLLITLWGEAQKTEVEVDPDTRQSGEIKQSRAPGKEAVVIWTKKQDILKNITQREIFTSIK